MTTISDDDLLAYYLNLLIIQYDNLPNAEGTLAAFVGQAIASQIIQQVMDGFNIETAFGVQLDALATYRGLQRDIVGIDFMRNYFSMPFYGASESGVFGFATYGQLVTWYWLTYEEAETVIYQMNDQELRSFTLLMAAFSSSTLGVGEIDQILYAFFGNYVTLIDNLNMTIVYQGSVSDPGTLFSIVKQTTSLPHPAGVAVTYTEV